MSWTLVTGAAKGLGKAICLELAKSGHALIIHYRDSEDEAKALKDQCICLGAKAEIIKGDFSTEESVSAFLQEYTSRFHETKNLINNVGNYHIGSSLDTSVDVWKDLFQTNFFAPLQLMQTLVPSIVQMKGSIINIGVVGIQGVPADIYAPAYTSSKLALWMTTKSLAKGLISKGVRVNMVSPGYLENAVDLPKDLSTLPQGRPVTLEETARVVSFLLDDKNSSITGQNVEIAGGIRL